MGEEKEEERRREGEEAEDRDIDDIVHKLQQWENITCKNRGTGNFPKLEGIPSNFLTSFPHYPHKCIIL